MLRLTDTRTRRLEPIVPLTPGTLKVYACGPTVYRSAHVGNLRTFLLSDLIRRTAQWHGLQVRLVQNITDVGHMTDDDASDPTGEDKILAQARAENKDPYAVARFYEAQFHRDQAAIGVLPADAYPRASECIDIMENLVQTLLDQGHAYLGGDGSVYFDAKSFPAYGEISGNRLDALRPGHRIDPNDAAAAQKRFHADWALWKHAGPERSVMVWDAPWGRGFPGWHLECSAMSLTLLGEDIDIHTGGIDLRFPHHEDEKAQSDSAVGHEVVRHWVHGEHLLFEGRKMAKSSGNVVLVSDVLDRGFDPLALRLAFLQTRYRQQANLTWDAIAAADRTLRRWRGRVAQWAPVTGESSPTCAEYVERVVAAFDDDLNTPAAVMVMRELERDPVIPPGAKYRAFVELDALFGLDLAREVGREPEPMQLPEGAQDLLARREQARGDKDWAASDRLREQLAAMGVAVTDTREGQTWQVSEQT